MKVESKLTSHLTEKFPPTDGSNWLGIDDQGNIYFGNSSSSGSLYYTCISGHLIGKIWTNTNAYPFYMKKFIGTITIEGKESD